MCVWTGWDLYFRRETKDGQGTREETVKCLREKKNQTQWKVKGKEEKNPKNVGDRRSLESRGKPKQSLRGGRLVKNQREQHSNRHS